MGETGKQDVSFQGATDQDPTPSGEQQGAPEAGKETTAEGLTKDQVLQLIDQKVGQQSEEDRKFTQSLVDRADTRMTKKVREKLAPIDELLKGMNLPAEQESKLKNELIDAIAEPESTQPSGQAEKGQKQTDQGGKGVDAITALGMELQKKAGVQIEENDPELAMVKLKGTPLEYIESIEQAISSKQKRLGTSGGAGTEGAQEPGEEPGEGDAAARMPGLGTSGTRPNEIANETDPRTLIQKGLEGK